MSRLTGNAWLADFDQTLQRYYAITCEDAGADGTVLQRYIDLPIRPRWHSRRITIWIGWTGGVWGASCGKGIPTA